MENKFLTVSQIRQISERNYDELLSLYRDGYKLTDRQIGQLSENDLRQTINALEQKIQTLATSLSTGWIIIIVILALILSYYLLVLRYKVESSAARKAGVPYSAVGVTGTRGGLFG